MLTIALTHSLLFYETCFMDIEEYLLGDCCVPWCASSTEVVECNVKPFVYFGMDGMIMIAN